MITVTDSQLVAGVGDAIDAAGHSISRRNNEWAVSDLAAVQAIIDSFDDLSAHRNQAYTRIIEQANDAAESLELAYPEIEKRTFIKQEAEARAYTADTSKTPATLTIIAAARGITVDVLAATVVAKADYYTAAAATIIGERQRLEDLIDVETDWQVIQNINFELV